MVSQANEKAVDSIVDTMNEKLKSIDIDFAFDFNTSTGLINANKNNAAVVPIEESKEQVTKPLLLKRGLTFEGKYDQEGIIVNAAGSKQSKEKQDEKTEE